MLMSLELLVGKCLEMDGEEVRIEGRLVIEYLWMDVYEELV